MSHSIIVAEGIKKGGMAVHPPRKSKMRRAYLGRRHDRNRGSAPGLVKLHMTIGQGEQRVIPTHANVFARMYFRATLSHDDVTGDDNFATIFFDS